jgi:dTMP kinase
VEAKIESKGVTGTLVTRWNAIPISAVKAGGRFIVFEGIDGSGKTTQAKLLRNRLTGMGLPVLSTAEPSDGPVGRTLRSLRMRPAADEEARLFAEDRADHTAHVILPALNEGRIVICDRYLYSSVAYQGARGIDPKTIMEDNEAFVVAPDVIFLLQVPVDRCLERLVAGRGEGFTPFETRENLERVAGVYADLDDPRVVRVAGDASMEAVHETVLESLSRLAVFEGIGIGEERGGLKP